MTPSSAGSNGLTIAAFVISTAAGVVSLYLLVRSLLLDGRWLRIKRSRGTIFQWLPAQPVMGVQVIITNVGRRPAVVMQVALLTKTGYLQTPIEWAELRPFTLGEGEYREMVIDERRNGGLGLPAGGRSPVVMVRDSVNGWWPRWRRPHRWVAKFAYNRRVHRENRDAGTRFHQAINGPPS